jgi:hypothetical protein
MLSDKSNCSLMFSAIVGAAPVLIRIAQLLQMEVRYNVGGREKLKMNNLYHCSIPFITT